MVRLRSLSTSALLCALFMSALLSMLPVRAYAQAVVSGVSCSTVNGVYVCTQQGTGGQVCVASASGDDCENLVTGGTTSGGSSGSLGEGLGQTNQQPSGGPSTGWLSMLTWWIADAIDTLFDAVVGFFKDLVTFVLGVVLSIVSAAISAVGTPSWLSNYSMATILGQTGSVVAFFLSQLQIPSGLALIGGGYVFRLTRKFLTLFQW